MVRLFGIRLAMSLMSVFLVAAFVFFIMRFSPVDPIVLKLGEGAEPEKIRELTEQLGLDRPVVVQFLSWFGGSLQGDFGISYFTDRSVASMIAERLPVTISLMVMSTILALGVGIGLGFTAGLFPDGWADRIVTSVVSLMLAIPSFWLALMLVTLFAVNYTWFPVAGYTPISQDVGGWIRSLILPSIGLSVHGIAVIARHMRGVVIDVMNSSFVESIRARGLPRSRVIRKYALRNALPAVLPIIGVQVAIIVASSAVMEKVFVLPGLGMLMVASVISSDIPTLQAAIVLIASMIIFINLLVDIGLGLLDPRVRPQ